LLKWYSTCQASSGPGFNPEERREGRRKKRRRSGMRGRKKRRRRILALSLFLSLSLIYMAI
jgi:hypothetical protein